jgi:hypothetical protein
MSPCIHLLSRSSRAKWLVLAASLAALASAHAQRDPTRAPQPPARAASGTSSGSPAAPLAVIVRDGQPHVVVGTRLYAQGDKLGSARIERITETEIWLREGKSLHKIARYSGVQRIALP